MKKSTPVSGKKMSYKADTFPRNANNNCCYSKKHNNGQIQFFVTAYTPLS